MGTIVSASLVCFSSLLVGRLLVNASGWQRSSWLQPAVGFGCLLAIGGLLAQAPGGGRTAAAGLLALVAVCGFVSARHRNRSLTKWRQGVVVAVVVLGVLAVPFLVGGWSLGGSNGLTLQLDWVSSLQGANGPSPHSGYPLGPDAICAALAWVPGVGVEQAFLGEQIGVALLAGLTALGAIGHLTDWRRTAAAAMVSLTYLSVCFLGLGALQVAAQALFVLATAVALLEIERCRAAGLRIRDVPVAGNRQDTMRATIVPLAIAAGTFFSFGVVGLLWPASITARWSLNRREVRAALRPDRLPRPAVAGAAGCLIALGIASYVFGLANSTELVADVSPAGSISPIAGLGIWPSATYGLGEEGPLWVTTIGGVIAVVAITVSLFWWLRRREAAVPVGFGVSSVIFLLSPLLTEQYSAATALAIVAPLATLVVVRPLLEETSPNPTELRRGRPLLRGGPRARLGRLAWVALALAYIGAAVGSTALALGEIAS